MYVVYDASIKCKEAFVKKIKEDRLDSLIAVAGVGTKDFEVLNQADIGISTKLSKDYIKSRCTIELE